MRHTLRQFAHCPACDRTWCVGSNVGFALWVLGVFLCFGGLIYAVVHQ